MVISVSGSRTINDRRVCKALYGYVPWWYPLTSGATSWFWTNLYSKHWPWLIEMWFPFSLEPRNLVPTSRDVIFDAQL